VRVTTSRGLVVALAARARRDIVLAPGVYEHPRPFTNTRGHRIWAEEAGRSVLRSGFVLGGNSGRGGALLRGLRFDVSDRSRTIGGHVIAIWGRGAGSQVVDTTIDGHGVLVSGIFATQPDGLVVRRVSVTRVTDYGIAVVREARHPLTARPPRRRPVIEDVAVAGVGRSTPRSSYGTAEACLWVGTPASVRRVHLRSCAWMGLWTGGSSRRSVFEDVDVDATPVGVYAEHYTVGATFRRLRVGPSVATGVTCEWADPSWGRRAACTRVVIEDSRLETTKVGVYLDEGTSHTVVRRVTFVGQTWAAIGDHRGTGNTFADNTFALLPGAVPLSNNHISAPP
jgi:hypothetical protein